MPTYDYKCSSCGARFEVFHGMNETPQVTCAQCQSQQTEKLISLGAGVVFKGSGFYVNDYKSSAGSSTKKGEAASAAGSPDSGSGSAKEEKKAATDTATTGTAAPAHTCSANCRHAH